MPIQKHKSNYDKFQKELETLVNKHSMENGSDTPDFLISLFLTKVLENFDSAIQTTKVWNHEDEKRKKAILEKNELLDCIHNLMGVFDTPVVRLKYSNDFTEEAIKIGRDILDKNGRARLYPADENTLIPE